MIVPWDCVGFIDKELSGAAAVFLNVMIVVSCSRYELWNVDKFISTAIKIKQAKLC